MDLDIVIALAADWEDALTTQSGAGSRERAGCLGNKQGVTMESCGIVRCSLKASIGSWHSALACGCISLAIAVCAMTKIGVTGVHDLHDDDHDVMTEHVGTSVGQTQTQTGDPTLQIGCFCALNAAVLVCSACTTS